MLQAPLEAHAPPSEAVVPTLEYCRLFIMFEQGHDSCNTADVSRDTTVATLLM